MALDVIGAGLGRTGSNSLKVALEQLLGGPCYHMLELFEHPEHVEKWEDALDGRPMDWDGIFAGYRATVDWTGAQFFRELASVYPDAVVLLSVRDPNAWWRSFQDTVVETLRSEASTADDSLSAALARTRRLTIRLVERFSPRWDDEAAAKLAFVRHNEAVRVATPPDRLVEWQPEDGWGPICAALQLPLPAEPFPHVNTTAEFRAMAGLARTGSPE